MNLRHLTLLLATSASVHSTNAGENTDDNKSAFRLGTAPLSHWDANAWDANSGITFWRAKEAAAPPVAKAQTTKTKPNQSTSVSGFETDTPRSSPQHN